MYHRQYIYNGKKRINKLMQSADSNINDIKEKMSVLEDTPITVAHVTTGFQPHVFPTSIAKGTVTMLRCTWV